MIVTTTPTIEGHTIKEYKGVVSGEVIFGMNFLKDFRLCLCAAIGDGAVQRLRHVPLGCEQPETAAQRERRYRRHE